MQDTVTGDYYTDTLRAAFAGLLKDAPYEAVPVVQLAPDGTRRFVEVAWPEGKPPSKTCLPPSAATP